jgi:hypothetical protein
MDAVVANNGPVPTLSIVTLLCYRQAKMPVESRELYSSPNGDRWHLVREPRSGRVFIKHEPNAASGGDISLSKWVSSWCKRITAPNMASYCV